jgi:hypothetical protein
MAHDNEPQEIKVVFTPQWGDPIKLVINDRGHFLEL